jgi:hypothetical protein
MTDQDVIENAAAVADIRGGRVLVREGGVRRLVKRRPDGALEYRVEDDLGDSLCKPLPAPLAEWMDQEGAVLTWRMLPGGARVGERQRLCLVGRDGNLLWQEMMRDVPVKLPSAVPHDYGGPALGQGGRLRHQSLTSASGSHTLIHQEDGDLVLYCNSGHRRVWSTDTRWAGDGWAELTADGDLVLRNLCGAPVWRSGTAGSPACQLEVGDDGAVSLRAADASPVWQVLTHAPCDRPGIDVGRGAVLRRGQMLRRQSLTSDDGGTVLAHEDDRLVLFGEDGRWLWDACIADAKGSRLILDRDGMLRVRSGDGTVALELGGPADELTVLAGQAELRRDTVVIWRNGQQASLDGEPGKEDFESWIDALIGDRVYCVTVIHDLQPDDALIRMGAQPDQIRAGTWQDLTDRAVAAFSLGPHTLLVEDNGFRGVHRPELSAGTFAVSCCRSIRADSTFVVFRDGAEVANHSYDNGSAEPSTPEVRAALAAMGADDVIDAAFWRDLELLCRTAGVQPTLADVTGDARIAIIPRRRFVYG